MADQFYITGFRPLFLTVEGIGPFQEDPYQLDFTDAEDDPCNMYLLVSENGRGKSSFLELMSCLMGMLDSSAHEQMGFEDLDRGLGRAQWDLLLDVHQDGVKDRVVLSLAAGKGEPWSLRSWNRDRLGRHSASERLRYGFQRHASGRWEEFGTGSELVQDLLAQVRGLGNAVPEGFEADTLNLPTLLHFSAYRDIARVVALDRGVMKPTGWGYQPVHYFGRESEGWKSSLDNLLVYLSWLDDDRFEVALKTINERVFAGGSKFLKGVRKDTLEAEVISNGSRHRLDRLSSGEKSLVQLYLRIGTHMTRHTILLVDEMDVHLHSKWQHRTLKIFKALAKQHEGLSIIATTHARELIPAFAHEIPEQGLRKGGHIIEIGLSE